MSATIPTSAQEILKRMIRSEFDNTDWWNDTKKNDLITIALSYEFEELAEEMKNDYNA